MLGRLTSKLVIYALHSNKLSIEDKNLCTGALLDILSALPLRTTITYSETGVLLINGKPVGYEQAIQLRESAKACLNSQARRLVSDQVRFLAIQEGIHKGTTPDQILFGKAALWFSQEEENLLKTLSGEE